MPRARRSTGTWRHLARGRRLRVAARRALRGGPGSPSFAAANLAAALRELRAIDEHSVAEPARPLLSRLGAWERRFYRGDDGGIDPDPLRAAERSIAAIERRIAWKRARRPALALGALVAAVLLAATYARGSVGGRAACPDGHYYRDREAINLVMRRRDCALFFDWGDGPPTRHVPPDGFSVRWFATLDVPEAGDYGFTLESDGPASLSVAGHPVVSTHLDQTLDRQTGVVRLSAGPAELTLSYRDEAGRAAVALYWTPPGGPARLLGRDDFVPNR